jgi:hypothetical protein
MRKNLTVRVLRTADDSEQDMPYKSFQYVKDNVDDVTKERKFQLLGWYEETKDESGKVVLQYLQGDPNQAPQHNQHQKSVDPVASVGSNSQAEVKRRLGRRPANVTLQETQA